MLQLKDTRLDWGAVSHAGHRPFNEDALRVSLLNSVSSQRGRLFAVADGLGGHQGGDVASRLGVQGLDDYYCRQIPDREPWSAGALSRHLAQTILRIDRNIRCQGQRHGALTDMGTTLSCLVVKASHTIIAHVGDTRIYRWRRGYLTCLTTDHTFIQDMIFEGEIEPAASTGHPLRHLLTRAVGTAETLQWVDTRIDSLNPGDRFLLCSDGLHNCIDAEIITRMMDANWPAQRIAAALAAEALQAGATDNVTAVVINYDQDGRTTKYFA